MTHLFVSRHHPASEDPAALEKLRVGRSGILDSLLRSLQSVPENGSLQHHLLVGPVGVGKTFLLTLLAHRVEKDPQLSQRWLPVQPPEELFEVNSLADFAQGVGEHALRVLTAVPQLSVAAQHLRLGLEQARQAPDNLTSWERSLAAFSEFRRISERRILVLVENLDRIVPKFLDPDDEARFQDFLQTTSDILLVGSAPTHFGSLSDCQGPLYGRLCVQDIPPLMAPEAGRLVRNLLERDQRAGNRIAAALSSPESAQLRRLMEAVAWLSGGMPRMVVLLYQMARDIAGCRGSLEMSLELLNEVFEKVTEPLRERVWALPAEERKVLMALAEGRNPLNPSTIAQRTRQDPRAVGTFLKRLKERFLVRDASLRRTRERLYLPTEPLFGLWLDWRRGQGQRDKIGFLVDFLAAFLGQGILELAEEFPAGSPEKSMLLAAKKRSSEVEQQFQAFRAESALSETETTPRRGPDQRLLASKKRKFMEASDLLRSGKLVKAEIAFRGIIKSDPKDVIAWNNLGKALGQQGKTEEEIAAYRKAVKLDPKHAAAWNNFGVALGQQGKYAEAMEALGKAVKLDPKDAAAWCNLGIALGKQGKTEEEIAAHRKAVKLDPKDAVAWNNLGVALGKQGKTEEEIAAHHKAVELDPKYAAAWYNLGVGLGQQGKTDAALDAYLSCFRIDPSQRKVGASVAHLLSRELRHDIRAAETLVGRLLGLERGLDAFFVAIRNLVKEKNLKEVVKLAGLARAHASGTQLEDRLAPLLALTDVLGTCVDGASPKALELLERMPATERRLTEEVLAELFGPDWLRMLESREDKE